MQNLQIFNCKRFLKSSTMGLVASYADLTLFASGTVIGATTMYILGRLMRTGQQIPVEERYKFPDLKDEYRLVMAIRNDLKMQKGKVAAQCGHASVAAYMKASKHNPSLLENWMRYGSGTKITVRVDSEEELLSLEKSARETNVLASVVRDAGQTQVAPGSRTVIAIGPAPKSVLDKITGHLKLY